jgi:outer membrane protein
MRQRVEHPPDARPVQVDTGLAARIDRFARLSRFEGKCASGVGYLAGVATCVVINLEFCLVKKLLPLVFAVFSFLAIAAPVAAQTKIGFVNIERLQRDSVPAKRAQEKLEKEFAMRVAEVQRLEKLVRDMESELNRETVTLPEAQRREKERQLQKVGSDYQRLRRELGEDLNARKSEELSAVMERAQKAINQIAEAEKFDIVFQDAVYASSRIDITEKVLKALER